MDLIGPVAAFSFVGVFAGLIVGLQQAALVLAAAYAAAFALGLFDVHIVQDRLKWPPSRWGP